ncbi:hypothetical protein A2U01_0119190, partial [Trifolium medium]|nr:hypothetical protein [Trifolium medium]
MSSKEVRKSLGEQAE